ncbi:hypothetical protein BLNAU_7497 [Blattamonas nauphoetae]|uniref:Uncharacterized protein n=1 Tax=Blattamonas nauphoetae TaxID=2049346 RepID=A0ABQ9Y1I3_9EUKA|nr:hypothetical protein BLNAU_7497 [Blattamonas nauphoetae]
MLPNCPSFSPTKFLNTIQFDTTPPPQSHLRSVSSLPLTVLIQNTSWKGHAQREILNDGAVCRILSIPSCFTVELPLFCHIICYWRGDHHTAPTHGVSGRQCHVCPATLAVTAETTWLAARLAVSMFCLSAVLHAAVFACAPSTQGSQR